MPIAREPLPEPELISVPKPWRFHCRIVFGAAAVLGLLVLATAAGLHNCCI